MTLLTGSRTTTGTFDELPLSAPLTPSQTLVFYMSFQHLHSIARTLVTRGMPPDTPALCVSWLSYPHQALLTAPLSQIGDAVAASELTPPSLLVVGDAVAFWQRLRAG